ncbi:hypothetical protein [Chryseobacterium mucoviscidosis]|uniref:hypothetical protein n=1 Tax=Chryseobacterium mucoviscidosis TaxID=1945581 RepID=UPI0031DBB789
MKKKLLFLILVVISFYSNFLYSQEQKVIDKITETKTDLKDSNIELKKMQDDNENLKKITDKLLKTNDSILNVIKSQNKESLITQKSLYENNYTLIENTLIEIENTEKQITNYRTMLAIAYSFTLISNLNSPTNSELGVSFSDIVLENSKKLLGKDLKGKSKSNFILTMERVVKIPLISGALNSNPITSLINNVFQQAIGYDNNKISQEAISSFNNSIQPYINFYNKIDSETISFRNNIMAYKLELTLFESNFNRYKETICKNLKTDENSAKSQLLKYFKKDMGQTLSLENYKQINNSIEINEVIRFINRAQNPLLNTEPFKNANKNYISEIVKLLNESSLATKFNNAKINDFVKILEETKKDIK